MITVKNSRKQRLVTQKLQDIFPVNIPLICDNRSYNSGDKSQWLTNGTLADLSKFAEHQ